MCNIVCYCCEKDICKCANVPKPTLADIIKQCRKTSRMINFNEWELTYYGNETFHAHIKTNISMHRTKLFKMRREIVKLGHEYLKEGTYDGSFKCYMFKLNS